MQEITIISQQEVMGRDFKIYGDFENPLFLAKDIAGWIEHTNTSAMVSTVDDGEKVISIVYTPGGSQEALFLTEDGLYEVLMQSRKPVAKQFKSEVKTVLKSIRRTGGYIPAGPGDTDAEIMARAMVVAQRTLEERDRRIERLQHQLDESKSWYTIKRVAAINRIDWRSLDWKALKRQSIVMDRPIRKIFDANYGEVNSYHVDVFARLYPGLVYG